MGNDNEKDKATATVALALGGTGAVLGTAALIAALIKPAEAAPPGEIPPTIIAVLDEEVRQALAAMLSQQLDTNRTLVAIAKALGAAPPVIEERILEPFKKESQTLQKGTPFAVYESKPGKGALIWGIFDVSDPDTKLSFRIDDLVWNFDFNTLLTQGVQQPLFPGAWLSKADAISGHYCIIFSAGTIEGFVYKQRLIISLTFQGVGTATLHEARGIKWTYL